MLAGRLVNRAALADVVASTEKALGRCALFFVVGGDALGEGVSVDSQHFRCIRKMFSMPGESLLDIDLFKLRHRFIQQNLAVQHFIDQGFELGAHLHFSV